MLQKHPHKNNNRLPWSISNSVENYVLVKKFVFDIIWTLISNKDYFKEIRLYVCYMLKGYSLVKVSLKIYQKKVKLQYILIKVGGMSNPRNISQLWRCMLYVIVENVLIMYDGCFLLFEVIFMWAYILLVFCLSKWSLEFNSEDNISRNSFELFSLWVYLFELFSWITLGQWNICFLLSLRQWPFSDRPSTYTKFA